MYILTTVLRVLASLFRLFFFFNIFHCLIFEAIDIVP